MSLQETLEDLKDRRREKRWFMRINLALYILMVPSLLVFALYSDANLERALKAMPFIGVVVAPWTIQLTTQVWAYLKGSSVENAAAIKGNAAVDVAQIKSDGQK